MLSMPMGSQAAGRAQARGLEPFSSPEVWEGCFVGMNVLLYVWMSVFPVGLLPQNTYQDVGIYPVLKIAGIWGRNQKRKGYFQLSVFPEHLFAKKSLQMLVLNPWKP